MDAPPDQLLRRGGEIALAPLVVEVDAVPGHAEHEVGQCLEERPVSGLRLGQGRDALLVLEGEGGRGGDRVEELRVVAKRLVVDDRRDGLSVPLDDLRGAPVRLAGLGEGLPLRVDVPVRLRDPVDDLDGRVAERAGDGVADVARLAHLAELEHERADVRAGEAGAKEAGGERERNGEERGESGPDEDLVRGDLERLQEDGAREEHDRRPEREVGRPERPALRPRRPPPAAHEHGDRGGDERERPELEHGLDRLRERARDARAGTRSRARRDVSAGGR